MQCFFVKMFLTFRFAALNSNIIYFFLIFWLLDLDLNPELYFPEENKFIG